MLAAQLTAHMIIPSNRGMAGGMRSPRFEPMLKKAKHGFKGYPVATIMLYGPDDTTATKIAVGIDLPIASTGLS
jgi:hypothetical protein